MLLGSVTTSLIMSSSISGPPPWPQSLGKAPTAPAIGERDGAVRLDVRRLDGRVNERCCCCGVMVAGRVREGAPLLVAGGAAGCCCGGGGAWLVGCWWW